MRFGKKFTRIVAAAGGTTLGTDATPSGKPSDRSKDNQLSWRLMNVVGFPIQRIAVGYKGPAAAASLPAVLWIYDDLSDAWYIAASGTLVPDSITWFDQPTLGDHPPNLNDPSNSGNAGCLDVALVVAVSGGLDPDGTYTFVMGADISNAP